MSTFQTIHQRGSTLIFALVLLAVMLSIILSFANSYVVKVRAVNQAVNATTAFYAADSAVEMCLFEALGKGNVTLTMVKPNLSYEVRNLATDALIPDCVGLTPFQFRAQGLYLGVGRALEITQ